MAAVGDPVPPRRARPQPVPRPRQPRPQPPNGQPRRRRRRYDPPPRTIGEALQRLWVVGPLAVVLVTILVIVTGPGDLSILRRLFVFFSTAAFGVWLLRDHRRRIPVRQRLVIFNVCAASLVVLFLVLTISAL
jgi:hypothetical protein